MKRNAKNPSELVQNAIFEFQKKQNSIETTVYDDSHEALNRDSCIFTAREFMKSIDENKKKQFVFLSASDTIGPLLQKYSQMKKEAENYLVNDDECQ